MASMNDPLVAKLIEIQESEGLNGVEFARRLGVHTSYWHLVRQGDRGVGRKLLDGALAAFPEFAAFYARRLTIGQNQLAATPTTAAL
jgi:hypothetical protein